jgi:ATP adenylyltransferase
MLTRWLSERSHPMDHLWTPWRYTYLQQVGAPSPDCIFCHALACNRDEESLIVHRGNHCFIILNRYPYTSGHVMIVPYSHVADLASCSAPALDEMMKLAQRIEKTFSTTYKPDGMNLGMNLGHAAGAGVAGHIHLHALPRWFGDSNFMSAVGETRVLPEDLSQTYQRLKAAL